MNNTKSFFTFSGSALSVRTEGAGSFKGPVVNVTKPNVCVYKKAPDDAWWRNTDGNKAPNFLPRMLSFTHSYNNRITEFSRLISAVESEKKEFLKKSDVVIQRHRPSPEQQEGSGGM